MEVPYQQQESTLLVHMGASLLGDRGSDKVGVARGSTTGDGEPATDRSLSVVALPAHECTIQNGFIEACTFPTMDVQIMCLADVKKQWNNSVDSSCHLSGR